jgi:amino acid adenylation domain-containing protein
VSETRKDYIDLSPEQQELFDLIAREEPSAAGDDVIPRRAPNASGSTLSFGQQRMWFETQLSPDRPTYNQTGVLRLEGPIRVGALERALHEVVRRHEILRTTFTEVQGEPLQHAAPSAASRLLVVDLGALPGDPGDAAVERLARQDAARLFDLSRGPLVRLTLVRLDETRHSLVITMHHIVCDGWSVAVLTRDLAAAYDALLAGRPSTLPPLPIQYADFAAWQRQRIQGRRLEELLAYWRERLAGAPPALELPLDHPRPGVPSFQGAMRRFDLPPDLDDRLQALCRCLGITPFMALLAGFTILLRRLTGQDDLVVGSPVAGRPHAATVDLIGFFVNSLVLRTNLSGDPTVRECLRRVRDVCLGAYAHMDLPFERLVEELRPGRSAGLPPLAQVSFMVNRELIEEQVLSGGLKLSLQTMEMGTGDLDLSFFVWQGPRGLSGHVVYNALLFEPSSIDSLLDRYRLVLEGIAAGEERRLSELPMLGEVERRRMLEEWNGTREEYGEGLLAHEAFAREAQAHPEAAAVVEERGEGGERRVVTYGDLERSALRLAQRLRSLGVGPEVRVAVVLERSAEMVLGIVGTLKAGGAYVPLDPQYGRERLEYMLRDASARVVLTERSVVGRLPSVGAEVICLDGEIEAGREYEGEGIESGVVEENLAYVIYTSGSTGRPKGVEVRHAGLRNLLGWHRREYGVTGKDRATQVAGVGFDASVWEIWPYLASGASVHVVPESVRGSAGQLVRWLKETGVTLCFLPTPLAEAVLEAEGSEETGLRALLTGGDRLRRRPRAGHVYRVVNHYGPTEGTVVATYGDVGAEGSGEGMPPIGRPIGNVTAYVLDGVMSPVPVGVAGELYIGGAGLARGYRGRPAETAERFVPDPFGSEAGGRLYRTGDRVRYLADGRVEFLGRVDDQVKIRGFRVEPGEVEVVLGRHEEVREAVVVARPGGDSVTRLVGYVVPVGSVEAEGLAQRLKGYLKGQLPDYMIPSAWVMLEALPLTRHGKVDRAALPGPKETGLERPYQQARGGTEEALALLWSEMLQVERVGRHDDFFDLGGHSLLAMQLMSRLRERMGVELPLRSLFETPTVAGLAEKIETSRGERSEPAATTLRRVPRTSPLALSFAQERLWLSDRLAHGSSVLNGGGAVRLVGRLNVEALERSLGAIVERHEVLRTAILEVEGRPVAAIQPEGRERLPVVDLSGVSDASREEVARALAEAEAARPFDLAESPLLRSRLLKLGDEEHLLVVSVNHIAFDGWSIGVWARELVAGYEAFRRGQQPALGDLPIQYADYAAWQRDAYRGDAAESELSYWRGQLQNLPSALRLPADHPRPASPTFRGAKRPFRISPELTRALRRLGRSEGATLFMTLLAGFKAWLHAATGQDDIAVGSPAAGRARAETGPLIGCFMRPLILRTDLSGDPGFREVLSRVRDVCLGAYAHQEVPFELVVQELQRTRRTGPGTLFQALFNMPQTPVPGLRLDGLEATPLDVDVPSTALDLSVHVRLEEGGVRGTLDYAVDLFERDTADAMLRQFTDVLERVAANPEIRLSELPSLAARDAVDRRQGLEASKVSHLSTDQQALLELLMEEGGWSAGDDLRPRSKESEAALPLSFGQERLWFFEQFDPGSPVYNEPGAFHIEGPLRVGALRQALTQVVSRHETLRTSFRDRESGPVQVIAPSLTIRLPVADLSGLPTGARAAESRRLVAEEAERPFDLVRGPLIRANLLRRGEADHLLLVTVHHSVFDGWSVGVFLRELAGFYQDAVAVRDWSLPALPIQYADFALWQRRWLAEEILAPQLAYWKRRLAGPVPLLALPTDRPRPAVMVSRRGRLLEFAWPEDLYAALKELSRRQGVTLFMMLLSAFKTLLHRYTGRDDILVDTPISGRNRAELEGLIGFFVNSLVLRTDLSGDPTFREVLGRVRESCLEAYANQDVPFERVVQEVEVERDTSRPPLAQVSFMLHKVLVEPMALAPGLVMSPESIGFADEMDLGLYLWEGPGGLTGTLKYSPILFDASTIERLLGHLRTLLEAIVADPGRRISTLPLLTTEERARVLSKSAEATTTLPGACVHHLFEEQARRTPTAPALAWSAEGGAQTMTYADLNERANRLARRLLRLGVGPEARVAVCMRRSPDLIAGLLGVLKAGGAYVPLDPALPAERLAFLVQDSGSRWLLTQDGLVDRPPCDGVVLLNVDRAREAIEAEPGADPASGGRPDSLAYVIYTSGSTGRPKGVLVPHCGVVNHNLAVAASFDLQPGDRVLQFHAVSFDAAVEEMFPTLMRGATLVLAPDGPPSPDGDLVRLAERERLTVLNLPTAFWTEWAAGWDRWSDLPASLRLLILGGDRIPPDRFAAWRAGVPGRLRVLNTYGPTEATVVATLYEPRNGKATAAGADTKSHGGALEVPIGRPIPNMRAYVLDHHLEPVPVGVVGELYLGGPGVSRGYLGRPELTAEAYVPDPLTPGGGRLYRTKDKARLLPDGNLEFAGRADDQLKIRGFRIEPGEIESVLLEHPGVVRAVVVGRRAAAGDLRLLAYVVPRAGEAGSSGATVTPAALRQHIKMMLPEHMVPSAFVLLDRLPLTTGGKVDRKALPEPDGERPDLERTYMAPRTPTEEILAGVWSKALGVAQVGIHDNFFELGGHSLLAAQIMYRIRETFGVELPVRALFDGPTVRSLALAVEERRLSEDGQELPPLKGTPREGDVPLSYSQEGLWYIDQLQPGVPFNIPLNVRLRGDLDLAALARSIDEIVRRHDVLRTVFVKADGRPVQRLLDDAPAPIRVVDLGDLAEPDRVERARGLAFESARQAPDLSVGPLLKLWVLRLSPRDHVLVLVVHHIVFDGWSAGVLARELAALYEAFAAGRPSPLPPRRIQYADFANWQRHALSREVLDRQLRHWKKRFATPSSRLLLGARRETAGADPMRGATKTALLPPALTSSLKALSRRTGSTMFMTLLAAFQTLLGRCSGQEDVTVGTPVAGRTKAETEDLIGFCVNLLPLRTDLAGNPRFVDLLGRVRDVCVEAYNNQDLPFSLMVKELRPERALNRTPLFQASFMLLGGVDAGRLHLPGLESEPLLGQGSLESRMRLLEIESIPAVDDLSLYMADTGSGLLAVLHYRESLLDGETVERLLQQWQVLLSGIARDPEERLWSLPLMTEGERHQIVREWNASREERGAVRCAHALFEAQALRTPSAVALEVDGREWSYAALDRMADGVARRLRGLGVMPEARVGLMCDRSLEMMAGLLGILKAGGAYVPLDPAYPRERLAYLLEDSGVKVVLTQRLLLSRLPEAAAQAAVCLEGEWLSGGERVESGVSGENAAYVIYTSGSTGEPKGVVVPHLSVVNHNRSVAGKFALTAEDRVLQFHSMSFDGAVEELFPTWSVGSRVVVRTEGILAPGASWHRFIEERGVTVVNLPTAYWQEWVYELGRHAAPLPGCLRLVIVGGEEPAPERLAAWRRVEGATAVRWINTYGPTEATVVAALYEAGAEEIGERVPIGKPIGNTALYVLDAAMNPVPVGAAGELYIGGAGVARGYLSRPDATAERFVPDPFGSECGARLYRTGDLARYRADGCVEFLGRLDGQVKVRGFRVEPGEIEAALLECASVREAAVVVREDRPGDRRLVAYVAAGDESAPSSAALRVSLQTRLPDYMIPSAFVSLPALPLTPTGKIDRRHLPAPQAMREDGSLAIPRDALESDLVAIWEEVLETRPVGVTDNFFELGGDSLLAVRLMSEIERRMGRELPLSALLRGGTIESLAAAMRTEQDATVATPVVSFQETGTRRPIFFPHAVDGNVLCYAELARQLGPDQPFYGLVHPGLHDGVDGPVGIEDLASGYVEHLRRLQPRGPYLLGGWSMGGIIALEMARRLQSEGEDVALVALLDAWAKPAVGADTRQSMATILGGIVRRLGNGGGGPAVDDLLRMEPEAQVAYVLERLRTASGSRDNGALLQRLARHTGMALEDISLVLDHLLPVAAGEGSGQRSGRAPLGRYQRVFKSNVEALRRYAPRPYSGPVVLFAAGEARPPQDPTLGWGAWVGDGLQVERVPGDHYTMLRSPHVRILAERLRARLDEAKVGRAGADFTSPSR